MKRFKVKDRSGRGFGWTDMNQRELLRFMNADRYEKEAISSMRVGQVYDENRAVFVKRVK